EGAGGLRRRSGRRGQADDPRQPVLGGGPRGAGRPDRRGAGAVRFGLPAPGGPGRARPLHQRDQEHVPAGPGAHHGRQSREVARTVSWETIPEMVLSTDDRFGDAEAVVDGDLRLNYIELVDRIRRAAGAFAAAGIEKGDRVAVWAPNSAEWIIAAFSLLTAGGVLVPVNSRFKQAEADDILTRSGAKAVLVQHGFMDLDCSPPDGVPVIDLKSGFLADGAPFERAVSGADIADIIFTSGTTGRSNGVMMNHRQSLRMYAEWCDLADLRRGDRYLIVNPFFHTFGYRAGLIASLIRGATILPLPVFDVDRVLELVARERVTMLP